MVMVMFSNFFYIYYDFSRFFSFFLVFFQKKNKKRKSSISGSISGSTGSIRSNRTRQVTGPNRLPVLKTLLISFIRPMSGSVSVLHLVLWVSLILGSGSLNQGFSYLGFFFCIKVETFMVF